MFVIDYAPKNFDHTFVLGMSNLLTMILKIVDLICEDNVRCGLSIVYEHLIYVQFGNGTHWFGANAKLIHPTAVSKQQLFRITLSRMRYGEGMVVVKEVMEAMIMGQRIFHYRIYALQAL